MSNQVGVGKESLRRWLAQAEVDGGERPGAATSGSAEIKRLKAENRRLREENGILQAASIIFAGELAPRSPIAAFLEDQRAHANAVESIWLVLGEHGPAGCRGHLPGLAGG